MPTGYTAAIEKGCTFEEYVWGCARAFGALIMMRDDSMDKPVPDAFEPSTYHIEQIERIGNEQAELNDATPEQIANIIKKQREEAVAYNKRRREEHAVKMQRYADMRKQVEAWVPPTPDHVKMKAFMLEQIDTSTQYEGVYERDLPEEDPKKWAENRKAELASNLDYHKQEQEKEMERTNSRNAWIRALRESVPQPVKPAKAA